MRSCFELFSDKGVVRVGGCGSSASGDVSVREFVTKTNLLPCNITSYRKCAGFTFSADISEKINT